VTTDQPDLWCRNLGPSKGKMALPQLPVACMSDGAFAGAASASNIAAEAAPTGRL